MEACCLQKVVEILEVHSCLLSGQVNMADEAKLHSPIYSTFEALIVHDAVRRCCGEELDSFC